MKKIKSLKKFDKSCERKENELSCFKRIDISEIPLSLGIQADQLQKTLTDGTSSEIDRAYARILLNPIVQKTMTKIKEAKGIETSVNILQRNEKNIKQTALKKIDKKRVEKLAKSDDEKVSNVSEAKTKQDKKIKSKKIKKEVPGKFVKNPDFQDESDDEEEAIPKFADPFFVDAKNGSNYLATITNAVSESSSDEMEVKQKHIIRKNVPHKIKRQAPSKSLERQQKGEPAVKKRVTESSKVSKSNGDELHPSWIAKQKQKKLQIQEFQGTKIKFDD